MFQRSSPNNKSKEESKFAKTFWRGKMTFWAVSSQVMKHGSTNTTLKRGGKVHNGRLPIPHDQKKKIRRSKSRVKTILLTFFILEGLFIMKLYQLDKLSTKFPIWKYWKSCVKKTETTRTFCQQLMDPASRQCTCSHCTVCERVFSY